MIPRKRHKRKKGKVLENLPLVGLFGGGRESPQIYESCWVWGWVSLVLQPVSHSGTHVHTGTQTHPSSFVKSVRKERQRTWNSCSYTIQGHLMDAERKAGEIQLGNQAVPACLPSKQAKAHRLLRSKRFLTTAQGSRKGKNENESAGKNATTMRWGKANYSPGVYYLSM